MDDFNEMEDGEIEGPDGFDEMDEDMMEEGPGFVEFQVDPIEMMNMEEVPEEVKQVVKEQLMKAAEEAAKEGEVLAILELIGEEIPDDVRAGLIALLPGAFEKAAEEGSVSDILGIMDDDEAPEEAREKANEVLLIAVEKAADKGMVSDILGIMDYEDVPEDARAKANEVLSKAVETAAENEDLSELVIVLGKDEVPDDLQVRALEAIAEEIGASQVVKVIGKENIPEAVQIRAVEIATEKNELSEVLESVVTQDVSRIVQSKAIDLAMEEEENNALLESTRYALMNGKLRYVIEVIEKTNSDEVKDGLITLLPEAVEIAQNSGSTGELLAVIGKKDVPADLQISAIKTLAAQGQSSKIFEFIGKKDVPGNVQTALTTIAIAEGKFSEALNAIGNPDVPAQTQIELLKIAAKNGWASDVMRGAESVDVPSSVNDKAKKLLGKAIKIAKKSGYITELLDVVGKDSLPKGVAKKIDEVFYVAIQAARSEEWKADVVKLIGADGLSWGVQKRALEVALANGLESQAFAQVENSNLSEEEKTRIQETYFSKEEVEEKEEQGSVVPALEDNSPQLDSWDHEIIDSTRSGSISGLFRIIEKKDFPKDRKADVMDVLPDAVDNAIKAEKFSQVIGLIGKAGVQEDIQLKAVDVAAKLGRVRDLVKALDKETLGESVRKKIKSSLKKAILVARDKENINDIMAVSARDDVPAEIKKLASTIVEKHRSQDALLTDWFIKMEAATDRFKAGLRGALSKLKRKHNPEREALRQVRVFAKAKRVNDLVEIVEKKDTIEDDPLKSISYFDIVNSLAKIDSNEKVRLKAVSALAKLGEVSRLMSVIEGATSKKIKLEAREKLKLAVKKAAKAGKVSQILEVVEKSDYQDILKNSLKALSKAIDSIHHTSWDPGVLHLIGEENIPEKIQLRAVTVAQENDQIEGISHLIGDNDVPASVQIRALEVVSSNGRVSDILGTIADKKIISDVRKKAKELLADTVEFAGRRNMIDEVIEVFGDNAASVDTQIMAVEIVASKDRIREFAAVALADHVPNAVKERIKELIMNPLAGDGVLSTGKIKGSTRKSPKLRKARV
jgi:hypothetical protein